jgi:hypothetical protein
MGQTCVIKVDYVNLSKAVYNWILLKVVNIYYGNITIQENACINGLLWL